MVAMQVKDTSLGEYIRTAKNHIRSGKQKAAFALLQQAVLHYPDDPQLLSCYGYLQAVVDRQYWSGIENCRKAVEMLGARSLSANAELPYPVLYLNLGRTYIAAGNRKEGLIALYTGLKYGRNSDIINELDLLGMRKRAPFPFLHRSNPLNKYVGIALHKLKYSATGVKALPLAMKEKRNSS